MRRILTLLLAVWLLCAVSVPAWAHDVPQDRNDCSVTVSVVYGNIQVTGGTLTAIRVGQVAEDDGNYFFVREYDYEPLTDLQSSTAPQTLLDFYNAHKDEHTFLEKTANVTNGKAQILDLPTGLYLVVQNTPAGGYSKLTPFLVSLPYLDEDGLYQYHLNAAAKSELERVPETTLPTPTNPNPWLPQTGQLNWPIPVMVCLGMVSFVCGWCLCFRVRRKDDGTN